MMSLEDALSIVQAGLTAAGLVCIVVFARQQLHKLRHPEPTPAQMVDKHDEICSVAPWPHAGNCCPNGGDGWMGRMLVLVMLADEGIGRVENTTGLRVGRDGSTRLMSDAELGKMRREDDSCEGQD